MKNVRIESGNAALAESVSMALLEWRYAPMQLNGTPVEVDAPITVTFRLKPKPSVSDDEHPVKDGETRAHPPQAPPPLNPLPKPQ